ncbi:uridine kinase [Sphingorhabdus sp. YGSMI21]|uniref:uridine kinase n=1 Tax=Sphingorhabdus sp. YGSMI21 TaxID=2077182 RepID=UPI000C1E1B0E|nr:uridine kinase [Sphingorhabdus sp. YGSMI21]ATW03035.1 uridine kinase [Sphingorhabdus sp. YGSMI21]
MTATVVGISGGSCSGKSTLTQLLFEALGPDQCVILPQDDYFFGLGDAPQGKGGPNFDHPNAVDFENLCEQLAQLKNGQAIDRPLYDFPTHMPKAETRRTESRPVILVDGILILQHRPLRELLDLSIFVECDSDTRFARRLERDVRERGRSAQSVREQFANQVGPMHDLHVEPSKSHADIVINSQQCQSHYEQPLRLILSKISVQNQ